MNDRKDVEALFIKDRIPISDGTPAATSSTLNDNQNRRGASTGNVSQRGNQPGLKTSKSGFPIAMADTLGRANERAGSALRRITTAPKYEARPIANRLAAASSGPAVKAAPRLISPAHLKSVQKAAKAFENFSLSRFAKDKIPENYIDPRKIKDPKAVQEVHRELIGRQLQKLPDTDTQNSGLTITFPVAKLEEVKKALPGMAEHGGEIKLDDLLTYLRGRMNGTTFYSRGNAVMKRLTAEMEARSKARAIIERVKNGSRGKRTGLAQSAATQVSVASNSSPNVHGPEKKGGSKS